MKRLAITFLLFASTACAFAQVTASAEALLLDAQNRAFVAKKNVFVLFQASW